MVDDTGFPKQGAESVGVDRQYSGTLGKTGNCQVAVSLPIPCGRAGEYGSWAGDCICRSLGPKTSARRQAAGVPEEVVFKKKWELALDLLDQARGWGLPDRIVVL